MQGGAQDRCESKPILLRVLHVGPPDHYFSAPSHACIRETLRSSATWNPAKLCYNNIRYEGAHLLAEPKRDQPVVPPTTIQEEQFPVALYTSGITDLISVIPPGARLAPSSHIRTT